MERNWAEHDRKIENNPSLEEAFGTGHTHAAYGWSKKPWGNWSEEHKAAYGRGYDSYKGS